MKYVVISASLNHVTSYKTCSRTLDDHLKHSFFCNLVTIQGMRHHLWTEHVPVLIHLNALVCDLLITDCQSPTAECVQQVIIIIIIIKTIAKTDKCIRHVLTSCFACVLLIFCRNVLDLLLLDLQIKIGACHLYTFEKGLRRSLWVCVKILTGLDIFCKASD